MVYLSDSLSYQFAYNPTYLLTYLSPYQPTYLNRLISKLVVMQADSLTRVIMSKIKEGNSKTAFKYKDDEVKN